MLDVLCSIGFLLDSNSLHFFSNNMFPLFFFRRGFEEQGEGLVVRFLHQEHPTSFSNDFARTIPFYLLPQYNEAVRQINQLTTR